jgi:predicted kinase
MKPGRVIVLTGLPATGKSTLARELAHRHRLPLLAKDFIKEPLLDVLGAADAAYSRRLSDASFATMFRLAAEWAGCGHDFILEGNFRPGEHEGPLRDALARAQAVQVLCRVPEAERLARLAARENDPARHVGHRFGEQQSAAGEAMGMNRSDAFIDLPGDRLVYDTASRHTVLAALDDWMNLRAASPLPLQSSEPSR